MVGRPWQGLGYATEASKAMCDWMAIQGMARLSAHIHPDHTPSKAVAGKLGLHPTGKLDHDHEGEMIWK